MTSFRPRKIGEWLFVVWRRKYVVLIVSIAGMLAAGALIALLPSVYESHASVSVASDRDRPGSGARATAVAQQLTSRPTLEGLVKKHGLAGANLSDARLASATALLSTAIVVDVKSRDQGPELISVAYRNTNPAVARDVVADLVSQLSSADDEVTREVADEAASLNSEMATINAQLLVLGERKAEAALRGKTADRMLLQQDALRAKREAAAASVDELNDKLVLLDRQIDAQRHEIAEREAAMSARSGPSHTAPAYGPLLAKKAELAAKLDTYLKQYTPKHPVVLATQSELAEVERQIALLDASPDQAGSTTDNPGMVELRGLRRDLSKMQAEYEITKNERDRKVALAGNATPADPKAIVIVPPAAPVAEIASGDDAEAQVEYSRLDERYKILMAKQLAIAHASTSGAQDIFAVVDPPNLPILPVGPNRLRLALVAGILAIALGLCAAIGLELRRLPLIHDARDVDYFLGVPVLALIPEMVTSSEHGSSRRASVSRQLTSVALAIAATTVLLGMRSEARRSSASVSDAARRSMTVGSGSPDRADVSSSA